MRINQNISAMNTYSRLTNANTAKAGSLAKLSSGLRINRAGDDAAGLAISEKMRGQVGGLKQAVRNAQDGISLIQTAEGALTETHSILNRMRELAVQASTDTNTDKDRIEIQKEIDELATEVTRISKDTEFNTMKLLNGDRAGANKELTFHIGANEGQNLKLNIEDMGAEELNVQGKVFTKAVGANLEVSSRDNTLKIDFKLNTEESDKTTAAKNTDGSVTVTLATKATGTTTPVLSTDANSADVKKALEDIGLVVNYASNMTGSETQGAVAAVTIDTEDEEATKASGIDVSSQAKADSAITTIDNAINKVSAERSKLGATQNRLEHTINNLTATAENLSEAESRIRDVDMAEEMMAFTKNNILSQAATAMLAQANQMPTSVLQLLQ